MSFTLCEISGPIPSPSISETRNLPYKASVTETHLQAVLRVTISSSGELSTTLCAKSTKQAIRPFAHCMGDTDIWLLLAFELRNPLVLCVSSSEWLLHMSGQLTAYNVQRFQEIDTWVRSAAARKNGRLAPASCLEAQGKENMATKFEYVQRRDLIEVTVDN